MTDLNDLLPIRMLSLVKPNKKFDNRLDIVTKLVANNGTELFETTNGRWAKHIMESANAYKQGVPQKYIMTRTNDTEIICHFEIDGIPIERIDGKIIKKNKDGTFVIGTDKEYSDRMRNITGQIGNIVAGKEHILPLDCPINAEFIFYVHQKRKKLPNLSGLVDAGLEELSKIGILHSKSIRYVSGTNGSRIVMIPNNREEHTQVIIRRMSDGY